MTLLILTLLVVTGLEMNRAIRVEATLAEISGPDPELPASLVGGGDRPGPDSE
jgi:hypothetical protein